jgi:hypothetical protein
MGDEEGAGKEEARSSVIGISGPANLAIQMEGVVSNHPDFIAAPDTHFSELDLRHVRHEPDDGPNNTYIGEMRISSSGRDAGISKGRAGHHRVLGGKKKSSAFFPAELTRKIFGPT